MSLLGQDYYTEKLKQRSVENVVPSAPVQEQQKETPAIVEEKKMNVLDTASLQFAEDSADMSEEDQVKKFGGTVGSPEYYKYKEKKYSQPFSSNVLGVGVPGITPSSEFSKLVGGSLGMTFPADETWDKMSAVEKGLYLSSSGFSAGLKFVSSLPKETVRAVARVSASIVDPWIKFASGDQTTLKSLSEDKPISIPWVGEVPTYFQTTKQAQDSGLGTLGTILNTAGLVAGDISITAGLLEAVNSSFRPKGQRLQPGEQVKNNVPVRQALIKDKETLNTKIVGKKNSTSEYYPLSRTVIKDTYKGNPSDTFLKLTPAGENSVEVSVIQLRGKTIPKAIDYIKNKIGSPTKTYNGDFGPEVKLESQIVKTNQKVIGGDEFTTTKKISIPEDIQKASAEIFTEFELSTAGERYARPTEIGGGTETIGVSSTFPKWLPDELKSKKLFESTTEKLMNGEKKLGAKEQRLVDEVINQVAQRTGRDSSAITNDMLVNEFQTVRVRGEALSQIPPKVLKGFENKIIESGQIENLYKIGRVNGLDSGVRDAVIRTITGKSVIGELTQADYVRSAQALASMKNINKYSPDVLGVNIFAKYGSPQRNWMRTYEEKSGIPLYSEVYVPLEESIRLRKIFRESLQNEARDIFGEYAKVGKGEERRLISAYMRGETNKILENTSLSPQVKTDLINVATKLRDLYNRVGPQVDVPVEIFLENYQPAVQNMGGIYQLYKEGSSLPSDLKFFAKFEKHGNLNVAIDDALSLFDIYVNAGSNSIFLNSSLKRIATLSEKLPSELQGSVKSYVLEKLGYAGPVDRWIDNLALNINKKLGTNLPPDLSRKIAQAAMDTTYSGAMGANPGKAIRNSLQLPYMTYSRLGPKFHIEGIKKAFDKAAIDEVRQKGFLVELGVPYGEEIAKEAAFGGKAYNTYRSLTQGSLELYSLSDQTSRVGTYWQLKLQFEDAFSRYNKGKVSWNQLEKELDFNSYSPVDRNIAREKIVSGDLEGAFDHLARVVIDETQFPYRRGSSSRITYGLGGKVGTQFAQWPIEFSHTHGRWLKTGQFDKVIRFWAVSSTITRSLKESMNVDFTQDMYYNPFRPGFSPFVKGVIDSIELVNAITQKDYEGIEENKDSLARAVKSLAIPAGTEVQSVKSFIKSYFPNKDATVQTGGPIGPDGKYPVYDSSGKLKYWATFGELWAELWGFRSVTEENENKLIKDMRNSKFDSLKIKEEVMQLYQREKFDEANQLISEYGIQISPSDFDKYLIPLSQRTYNSIPALQKVKFAPKVYK